jgi:predicted Zn-dependent peptidase
MAGMVLGQLLGGGMGGLWVQQMRGEKPLAYHAFAGWQLTPVGGELFLFASCLPDNLPAVRRQAQKLLADVRQGRFSDQDFQRAQRLALLRYRQLLADPIEHGTTLTSWLLAGQRVRDWLSLPQRLPTLSPDTLRRFCQRLPFTVTEVIASP